MKKITIILLFILCLLISNGCTRPNVEFESNLPFKTVIISYEYTGNRSGEETVYIDVKTNKIAVDTMVSATLAGIIDNDHNLILYDGKTSYGVDLNKKSAIKVVKEGDIISEIFGEQLYQNYYVKQDIFLDKLCKVYETPKGIFYFWHGILLKQDVSLQLMGKKVNFTKEATCIDTNTHISQDKFKLPRGLKITSMDKIMKDFKKKFNTPGR